MTLELHGSRGIDLPAHIVPSKPLGHPDVSHLGAWHKRSLGSFKQLSGHQLSQASAWSTVFWKWKDNISILFWTHPTKRVTNDQKWKIGFSCQGGSQVFLNLKGREVMIHMNWCHQFGGSKYGAYMNESTRSQDNCNAAPTFARIFSAPMAIPACASPPIKGWLPALGKFIIRKRFLSSSAEYILCAVLWTRLPQVHNNIMHAWCWCDPSAQQGEDLWVQDYSINLWLSGGKIYESQNSPSSVCNNYLDFPLPPPLVLQTLRSSPSSPGIVVLGRQWVQNLGSGLKSPPLACLHILSQR